MIEKLTIHFNLQNKENTEKSLTFCNSIISQFKDILNIKFDKPILTLPTNEIYLNLDLLSTFEDISKSLKEVQENKQKLISFMQKFVTAENAFNSYIKELETLNEQYTKKLSDTLIENLELQQKIGTLEEESNSLKKLNLTTSEQIKNLQDKITILESVKTELEKKLSCSEEKVKNLKIINPEQIELLAELKNLKEKMYKMQIDFTEQNKKLVEQNLIISLKNTELAEKLNLNLLSELEKFYNKITEFHNNSEYKSKSCNFASKNSAILSHIQSCLLVTPDFWKLNLAKIFEEFFDKIQNYQILLNSGQKVQIIQICEFAKNNGILESNIKINIDSAFLLNFTN